IRHSIASIALLILVPGWEPKRHNPTDDQYEICYPAQVAGRFVVMISTLAILRESVVYSLCGGVHSPPLLISTRPGRSKFCPRSITRRRRIICLCWTSRQRVFLHTSASITTSMVVLPASVCTATSSRSGPRIEMLDLAFVGKGGTLCALHQ
ncbi:hypothetical protein BX666DRAFT_2062684, partial [Dichotomocladium elegans]